MTNQSPCPYGYPLSEIAITHAMSPTELSWVDEMSSIPPISTKPTYWGAESLLLNGELGVYKLISMRAGCHSSLEYHRTKEEIYFLRYGRLRVNLRTGRAENSCVELRAGERFKIPPGQMHQRVCLEDCELLEWASHDDPRDTHLVEDGKMTKPWEPPSA